MTVAGEMHRGGYTCNVGEITPREAKGVAGQPSPPDKNLRDFSHAGEPTARDKWRQQKITEEVATSVSMTKVPTYLSTKEVPSCASMKEGPI